VAEKMFLIFYALLNETGLRLAGATRLTAGMQGKVTDVTCAVWEEMQTIRIEHARWQGTSLLLSKLCVRHRRRKYIRRLFVATMVGHGRSML
jgi:hypothetical protein